MLKRIIRFLKIRKIAFVEAVIYLLSLLFFLINATYVSYPDGFSNLMGATFVIQGFVPFRDFFNHHMPFAWYLGALIMIFTQKSFVAFRLLWSILAFLSLGILGIWIRKNSVKLYKGYLLFFLIYPLLAVYFWLHLYLADSLAALLFSLIFWLLLAQSDSKNINIRLSIVTSILTFCLVLTSLTYIYAGLVLYLWQLYHLKTDLRKMLRYCLIAALPYLGYFIYLLLTKSLADFYFANVIYNTDFYIDIPNYTKGRFFNPLKFGFTLIYNFWGKYLSKLTTIKDLNLYLPIGLTAILGSFVLLIILLKKRFVQGAIFFLLLSFSAPRGNMEEFKETDYQIGVFLLLGVISAVYFLIATNGSKLESVLQADIKRIVRLILGVYLFFSFVFLLKNTYDKWYLRYTQKMPSIMDKSFTADFLDEILEEGDNYWVGPYEPHESFFVKKGRIPGRYYIMLPQYGQSDYIKNNFISDFAKNPPKVIIFKTDTGIFGTPTYEFGSFLLDWMRSGYTLLEEFEGLKILKSPSSFKIDKHLYILNSEKDEILMKLKNHGYIN